jgi:superkiller protein 3
MSGKAALKPIIAAIKAEKYDEAVRDAEKVLAADPTNHQA